MRMSARFARFDTGANNFVSDAAVDGRKRSRRDAIHDFDREEGDMIDLSECDANTMKGSAPSFKFIANISFHDNWQNSASKAAALRHGRCV